MSFPFFYCFVSILDDISKRLGCVDNDITVWIAFRKGEEIVELNLKALRMGYEQPNAVKQTL